MHAQNIAHRINTNQLRSNTSFAGVATLELVLCLPILLALVIGVVWLGNSVIAQTEVTIEARHRTWQSRDESKGTALLFLKDDVVSEDATQKVEASPLFDGAEQPESSHDVMTAAWDHSKLPLDKAPNWKQYAIAAANAKTGSIQNAYVDASNKFTQFKNVAKNVWSNILSSLLNKLTSFGDQAKSILQGGEASGDAKKERERARIERALNDKRNELTRAEAAARNTGEETSEALKKVLKNRVKRLKMEVDDLKSDLEALD